MASVSKRKWAHNGQEKEAWSVRYVDGDGVKRRKTFARKKDADRFSFKVSNDMENGILLPESEMQTVRQVCDAFMRDAEDRFKDGRIGRNRYVSLRTCIDCSIIPNLGARKINQITAIDLGDFYKRMRNADRLAPRTAKDRIYNYSLIEEFARKRGWVKISVAREALKDLRGMAFVPIRTFSAEQVGDLVAAAEYKGFKSKARTAAMVRCMVHLAAFCGLRFGEIMGLNSSSLDFDRRLIKIRQALIFSDELKGPKTRAGNRDVPMPTHVSGLLKDWIERHYVKDARGLIFRTPKATIVSNMNFHRSWKDLLARAGLEDGGEGFHFHALRHFAASWMIENGLPVTDVAKLLGHSKFDTTLQTYAHPVVHPHMRHEAIENMVEALPKGSLPHHGPIVV